MTASEIEAAILARLSAESYRPLKPRQLARNLELDEGEDYGDFKQTLRLLYDRGDIQTGPRGGVVMGQPKPASAKVAPPAKPAREAKPVKGEFEGTYRGTKRSFGFVAPSVAGSRDDLFIPEIGNKLGAIAGDIVRAVVTGKKDEGDFGEITAIVKRSQTKFPGTLVKINGQWFVEPDGNIFKSPIATPDAIGLYEKPGTKVVAQITQFPKGDESAVGVISEVLGQTGEKDVDLRGILAQYDYAEDFPEAVKEQASNLVANFDATNEIQHRLDLTQYTICTIDPDDAKDYDDAISLDRDEDGNYLLGVHIADVSYFVETGTPLDEEAVKRGNSVYFPGRVIPMLPEVLSNGVCSLQEGVPRLVKSAFITLDQNGYPLRTAFANSVINSAKRLRYREAQALIDGASVIPHPEGDRKPSDYPSDTVALLHLMNDLAQKMHTRRQKAGQLTLQLPEVDLKLDEEGRVIDAVPEDTSFTHTLIEMFMVEANEAVARLLDKLNVPFLRRIHPDPNPESTAKLNKFIMVAGHKMPRDATRFDLQKLLAQVAGKPEGFAVNLAILKSLSRAEYSPEVVGHYALASEHYTHFTSPIRRYCDLSIHRLLDAFFDAVNANFSDGPIPAPKNPRNIKLQNIPSEQDLMQLGEKISYTERRADDAERELRQVKLLTLMEKHIGEDWNAVVTGITNFGIFLQLDVWLVDGLVKYPELMDEWWEVDASSGVVRGKRTGQKIRIGDVATVKITAVDLARRELNLKVLKILSRGTSGSGVSKDEQRQADKRDQKLNVRQARGKGGTRRPNAAPETPAPLTNTPGKKPAKRGAPSTSGPGTGTDARATRSKARDQKKTQHRRKRD